MERLRERTACSRVVEEVVGPGRDLDGFPCELERGRVLAARRQCEGARAAPVDRRLEVVAGEGLALVRERLGLLGASLLEERTPEQRCGARGVDAEPVRAEALVRGAQQTLRRGRVALEQLDQ